VLQAKVTTEENIGLGLETFIQCPSCDEFQTKIKNKANKFEHSCKGCGKVMIVDRSRAEHLGSR